jgi:hypothetical protein
LTNSPSDSQKSEALLGNLSEEVLRGTKGVQTPRIAVECPQVGNYAEEAGFLASKYGLTPDPWQNYVLRQWLAYREDGKWSHSRAALSVPRQNGKNALLEIRELFGMIGLGEKILHTAHEVKTARKAFLRLVSFFENERKYPELVALVDWKNGGIRKTNGQEAIYLKNGGSIEFVARSKNSARGFTVDIIVMDEAQEMSDEALEALSPTTASAPLQNRQSIWTGTPPSEGMNSEVFTRIRTKALEGESRRVSYLEWSMDDDGDPYDIGQISKANPALNIRTGLEELLEDLEDFSVEGFARERGGCWKFAGTNAVIDPDSWARVGDGASTVTDPVAFAVDGLYHVEVIDNRTGTDWIIPRLTQLIAQWSPVAVVVDGPASSVVPELESLRVPVYKTNQTELGTACGMFYDAVMGMGLRHPNQPVLSAAVDAGRQRPLGDMWAWGRKLSESDITPVVAVTLALYGFVVAKPKKKTGRGRVVGNRTNGNRRGVVR